MQFKFSIASCLFVVLLSFIYGTAFAASGWTNSTTITEVNQQHASGAGATLVFIETTLTANPSGCSYVKGFYFSVNDERQKRLFAMLLSALLSGRNVKIYTTGTCHTWGYADLDGFIIN